MYSHFGGDGKLVEVLLGGGFQLESIVVIELGEGIVLFPVDAAAHGRVDLTFISNRLCHCS